MARRWELGFVFIDATVTDEKGKRLGKTRIRIEKNKLQSALLKLRQAAKEVGEGTKVETLEIGESREPKKAEKTPFDIPKKKPDRPALWDSKTPFGV